MTSLGKCTSGDSVSYLQETDSISYFQLGSHSPGFKMSTIFSPNS